MGTKYFYFGSYFLHVRKDYPSAETYFRQAMALNQPYSYYNLAQFYWKIKQDDPAAVRVLQIGMEHQNIIAAQELGYYYSRKNNRVAMESCYDQAIKLGGSTTARRLASIVATSYPDLMVKYYLIAIEQDDIESMLALSNYYLVTNINNQLAKQYLEMALAKLDLCSPSQKIVLWTNLSFYYSDRVRNIVLFKQYARQAAQAGGAVAMSNLAAYYANRRKSRNMKKYTRMMLGTTEHWNAIIWVGITLPKLISHRFRRRLSFLESNTK